MEANQKSKRQLSTLLRLRSIEKRLAQSEYTESLHSFAKATLAQQRARSSYAQAVDRYRSEMEPGMSLDIDRQRRSMNLISFEAHQLRERCLETKEMSVLKKAAIANLTFKHSRYQLAEKAKYDLETRMQKELYRVEQLDMNDGQVRFWGAINDH